MSPPPPFSEDRSVLSSTPSSAGAYLPFTCCTRDGKARTSSAWIQSCPISVWCGPQSVTTSRSRTAGLHAAVTVTGAFPLSGIT